MWSRDEGVLTIDSNKMLSHDLVRSVLESAPDAMIVIDDAGMIVFGNHQVSELFGYPIDEVLGRPVELLLPERFRDTHASHRRSYTEAVRVRPIGMGPDLLARRKDGSEFPVEISLSPIREGETVLVAAAVRDVTDRNRVEREIKEAHAAADRANLAKTRFLAMASHDLRQPLQALALLNGTLRRVVTDEGAREAVLHQAQAITAMTRLLNALLDISKLESGAVKPAIVDFKVVTLLEEMRVEFTGIAETRGLKLIVEPSRGLLRSDPSLLGQALKNLVANAIKYTREGFVRLRSVPHGRFMRLEVSDSGIGIAPDQIVYIFDEFYQVNVAADHARDGYGLGLSIVQRVASLLGVRIEVQSEPGVGSTFVLDVPMSEGNARQVAQTHENERGFSSAHGKHRLHVLVVEDDEFVRAAMARFLATEGYTVTTAASRAEALTCMRNADDVSLVVTDYRLDGQNTGTEIVRAAREHLRSDCKAILVTGDTSSEIRELHRDPNLRIISKPIDADELLNVIQTLLDS